MIHRDKRLWIHFKSIIVYLYHCGLHIVSQQLEIALQAELDQTVPWTTYLNFSSHTFLLTLSFTLKLILPSAHFAFDICPQEHSSSAYSTPEVSQAVTGSGYVPENAIADCQDPRADSYMAGPNDATATSFCL